MHQVNLDVLVALSGTLIAVLALYQQSYADAKPLRLTLLGRVLLLCIIASGLFTLQSVASKQAEIAQERERALNIQLRLEQSGRTIERLGGQLQQALAENSRLVEHVEAMKQDLDVLKAAAAQAAPLPQYIEEPLRGQMWRSNVIVVRLQKPLIMGDQLLSDPNMFSQTFSPGPLRRGSRNALVDLVNVRPADMLNLTFSIVGGDVSPRQSVFNRNVPRPFMSYSGPFSHGETVRLAAVPSDNISCWVSSNEPAEAREVFLKRNPQAALRITLR